MSTLTAQILAGIGHPNDDGILPQGTLALFENSRPFWQLDMRRDRLMGRPRAPEPRRTWIPSCPERILEEGLLMLALYVWPQPALIEQARGILRNDLSAPRQDLTTFNSDALAALCEAAHALPALGKVVITVLTGSSLRDQLPHLAQWPLEAEVCTPRWWRMRNQWEADPRIGGSLELAAVEGL